MVEILNKFTGLLILVFLAFNMVACQQDIPVNPVTAEATPPNEVAATHTEQIAASEIPSVTLSPLSEETIETPAITEATPLNDVAVTPVEQTATTEMSSATPASSLEKDIAFSGQWQALDTTGGGGQTSIAPHPTNSDIVYVASDNAGLFKTENGGTTWFSVSSNLGVYRLGFVTLDPLNPEVIYVTASTDHGQFTKGGGTGEIHRSLNGGLFWQFVSDEMGFQSAFPSQVSIVIPYDSNHANRFDRDGDRLSDVILVGGWTGPADPPVGGIWRSEDEGKTFTHLALQDKNITTLRAFPGDADLLHVTTYEGEVYRSEDLGESWSNITGNISLPDLSDLIIDPTDKDILYVACRQCQAKEPVWKTTDGGQNWYPASRGLNSNKVRGFPKLLMDRVDPEILYATTYKTTKDKSGVYQSIDGGSNWHLMPPHFVLPDGRPYHRPKFGGRIFAIAQAIDGRLFTVDGGAVWRYPDGNLTDGREAWEPATLGLGNIHVNTIKVDPFNSSILYQGISDQGPYKSIDQGLSFHRILGNGWPVTVDNFVWNGPYYSNYKYCSLACASTCRSPSNGQGIGSGGTTDFAISQQDSMIIYSAFGSGSGKSQKGGVNKSTDGGETWQPVGFQLDKGFELNPETCVPYGFRHLAIDSTNDNILFTVQEIPPNIVRLYKTSDGGATWTEVYEATGFTKSKSLEVSLVDPDLVILASQSGVYKSDQGGAPGTWQDVSPPNTAGKIRTVSLSPHDAQVIVVGTNSQGLFYTTDSGQSWTQQVFKDLFEQKLAQGSSQYLDPEIATAYNPGVSMRKNITAIIFDPIESDTFYIAGTQLSRASFGVAKVTQAGQTWERLPLTGLTHRNVFDMVIDSSGEYLYAGTFNGTYRFKLR